MVKTAATGWLSEGVLLKLYGRPFSVLGQLMAQTVGGWVPMLLMYSMPVLFLAPLLGVRLIPASPAFFLSLLLCISLGFAIDFLFACLSIRLRNINWLINQIRTAIGDFDWLGGLLRVQPCRSQGSRDDKAPDASETVEED